ncbi:MAG: hypothetical protein ACJ8AI_32585 [Rhodopila sp.]
MPMSNRLDGIVQRTIAPFAATLTWPVTLPPNIAAFFFSATTAFRRAAFAASLRWRCAASIVLPPSRLHR